MRRGGFKTMDEEFAAVAQMAIKRVEVPDDLVGAVSFLTSDDAAFIWANAERRRSRCQWVREAPIGALP